MNLGNNKWNLNRNNNGYLLGFYFLNSIINLDKIVINLKKNVNFLIKICKKSKKSSFLVINDNKNKLIIKSYINTYNNLQVSYYNGSWWNGLLKSFKSYIKHNTKKNKKFKFQKNQYPNFAFYVSRQKYGEGLDESFFITKEINSISMLNLFFCGLGSNILKNPNVLFQNIKTSINNIFLNKLIVRLIKKCLQINKKFFLFKIFKKYLLFNNKKIFFEFNFLLKNKKKYFIKKWDGDLS